MGFSWCEKTSLSFNIMSNYTVYLSEPKITEVQNQPNSNMFVATAEFNIALALAQWFLYLIISKLSTFLKLDIQS